MTFPCTRFSFDALRSPWRHERMGVVALHGDGVYVGLGPRRRPSMERVEADFMPRERGRPVEAARLWRVATCCFPMALPFVDDFAWPSMYDEEGPVNLKRWEPQPVRRTTTMAFQPPTVGCATLDSLDASGDPYALTPVNPTGYADTLTSRRLLLGEGYVPSADSVALSFWYQSGGIANGADAGEDSLVVEFRASVAGRRSMAVGVVHGRHRRRHLVPSCGHPHRRPGVLPQRLSISVQELRFFGRQRRHLAPRLRACRRGRRGNGT